MMVRLGFYQSALELAVDMSIQVRKISQITWLLRQR